MRISTVLFIVALVVVLTDAFISPTQRRVHQQHHYSYPPPTPSTTTLLKALPEFIYNPSVMLSDGLSAATYMTTQDEFNSAMSAGNGPLGALRTFFIVITAAVFGITALVYLTAAFLVPRAAEQLEKDTKRLQPGLWEEYQEKLEDGETMVNRPELLQELGKELNFCNGHSTTWIVIYDYDMTADIWFHTCTNIS